MRSFDRFLTPFRYASQGFVDGSNDAWGTSELRKRKERYV